MRDVFFSVVNDIVFKDKYCEKYYAHANRIDKLLSFFSALGSAGGIYAWTRVSDLKLLWSAIIVIAQLVQIVRSYLPYSRRLNALTYLLPEMHQLVVDVEYKWHLLEQSDDADYGSAVYEFRTRYNRIDAKYLGADPIPSIARLKEKAESDKENHLDLYIRITEGGDNDVEYAAASGQANADERCATNP